MAKCAHEWVFSEEKNPKTGRTWEVATCKNCKWRRAAAVVRDPSRGILPPK